MPKNRHTTGCTSAAAHKANSVAAALALTLVRAEHK